MNKIEKKPKNCMTCGGTGWQWLSNSWFIADGWRKEKCGICDGTGLSTYTHHDTRFVRLQANLRDPEYRQSQMKEHSINDQR